MLTGKQQDFLLQAARTAISVYLAEQRYPVPETSDPELRVKRGTFVTLYRREALQGCIGLLEPRYPLNETVCRMAVEAAFNDPRFTMVSRDDLPRLTVEISVLTPLQRVRRPEEITIPGDGVLIRRGTCQGVFLPQVALETGWNREEFLANLCARKAGLSPDAWKNRETELYHFQAEVFSEKEPEISANR